MNSKEIFLSVEFSAPQPSCIPASKGDGPQFWKEPPHHYLSARLEAEMWRVKKQVQVKELESRTCNEQIARDRADETDSSLNRSVSTFL